ncbi:hypothetical protein DFH27DRAFT_544747, partial [Peziza echinospora]
MVEKKQRKFACVASFFSFSCDFISPFLLSFFVHNHYLTRSIELCLFLPARLPLLILLILLLLYTTALLYLLTLPYENLPTHFKFFAFMIV